MNRHQVLHAHTCLPILLCFVLHLPFFGTAQSFFPIKKNKKWGLMNEMGQITIPPIYDAIGEFKQFGYAVMQQEGRVGLLDASGDQVIAPKYDDIKVLDSLFVAVMDKGEWMVINFDEQTILPKGYQRVIIWESQYLVFMEEQQWGIRSVDGQLIVSPQYDEITYRQGFFQTKKDNKFGLLHPTGLRLLSPRADDIQIHSDSLFFFNIDQQWGAVDQTGREVIPPRFDRFNKIATNFIQLVANDKKHLYVCSSQQLITTETYDDYYPFSKQYIIVKKDRQLGLMNTTGRLVLPTQYNEIQPYSKERFRVNRGGKWGILDTDANAIIPLEYEYIAPLQTRVCVVRQAQKFGIVNSKGQQIIQPQYDRIVLADNEAKAYKNETLTVLRFDENGQLKDDNAFEKHFTFRISNRNSAIAKPANAPEDNYMLPQFEWFYFPPTDRWGLRNYDGSTQIAPTFDYIQIERELGFTLVGIDKIERATFDRTKIEE
ncbi:MAG: WG repeat-containing protein, partial [Bacteroidota bacterium]